MRGEFGQSTEVETHIEPLQDAAMVGSDVQADTLTEISTVLARLAANTARSLIFTTCGHGRRHRPDRHLPLRTAPDRTVTEIHRIVDELERGLRAECQASGTRSRMPNRSGKARAFHRFTETMKRSRFSNCRAS